MNIGADGVVLINGLKDQVRGLEAEVARLAQIIDDYGQHKLDCFSRRETYAGFKYKCSCGLDAARQRTPDTATDGKAE